MLNTLCADYLLSCFEAHQTSQKVSNPWDLSKARLLAVPVLKKLDFVAPDFQFTDDTVLCLAMAQWLIDRTPGPVDAALDCALLEGVLKHWGLAYRDKCRGYGASFSAWLDGQRTSTQEPSFSNGCLMRLEPVLVYSRCKEDALPLALLSTRLTHGHPQALAATRQMVSLYYELQHGASSISHQISLESAANQLGCELDLEKLHCEKQFQLSAQACLKTAVSILAQSSNYDELLSNLLYVGGDTDTVGVVAFTLARARWGLLHNAAHWIERSLRNEPQMKATLEDFAQMACKRTFS